MSTTSSVASSPASSRSSSPIRSRSPDISLSNLRNALPRIRTNRNHTQNNDDGDDYTAGFEAARRGERPIPRFNPNPQDTSPDTVLSPLASVASEESSPAESVSSSSSSAESSPAGSPAFSPPKAR